LYRDTATKAGHADKIKVSINSHSYVADSEKQAADEFYPPYAYVMTRIGRERGWQPMNRAGFDYMRTNQGPLLVGSPQQIIDKILYEYELFKHDRFLAQMSVGAMPHKQLMRSIELFGTKVVPEIRKVVH